jgi:hypothetical protein
LARPLSGPKKSSKAADQEQEQEQEQEDKGKNTLKDGMSHYITVIKLN